jgi:hypothetical protein
MVYYAKTGTIVKKKRKLILETGHGSIQGCGTLRIPYCLDKRLTDGGEVVSLMRQPYSIP